MKARLHKSAMLWLGLVIVSAFAGPAYAGDTVCFEAELVLQSTAPMQVMQESRAPVPPSGKKVKGASKGQYLEVPQGKGNPPKVTSGVATIRFDVANAGDYHLWSRAWWEDSCGNSFSFRIDDGKPFVFGQDGTYTRWHWIRVRRRRFRLSKGTHTLHIINREDGARIDQVLFTTSKRFVPVGIEDCTVTPHTPPKN